MKKEERMATAPLTARGDRDVLPIRVVTGRILLVAEGLIKVALAARALAAALTVVNALREEMQGRTIDSRVKEKIKVLLRKHP